MVLHLTALAVACALALAGASVVATAPAGASESCDLAHRPSPTIVVSDDSGASFELKVALDETGIEAIDSFRTLARFSLRGFEPETAARVLGYIDSIEAWYLYQSDPCADAEQYPGPFVQRPQIPDAPYGFASIDPDAPPEFQIVVLGSDRAAASQPSDSGSDSTRPIGSTNPAVAFPDVDLADRPALAQSGSESFVLAYFGAGLLAFGATALGMRRWVAPR